VTPFYPQLMKVQAISELHFRNEIELELDSLIYPNDEDEQDK